MELLKVIFYIAMIAGILGTGIYIGMYFGARAIFKMLNNGKIKIELSNNVFNVLLENTKIN